MAEHPRAERRGGGVVLQNEDAAGAAAQQAFELFDAWWAIAGEQG